MRIYHRTCQTGLHSQALPLHMIAMFSSPLSTVSHNALYPSCRSKPCTTLTVARSTKQTKKGNDKQPKKKQQGFLSQFTDAIDFAQTRSEDDRNLIDNAKLSLGKKAKPGEDRQKMSKEQYQALRRKVGGTARDYWKDYVEADEVKGYKSTAESSVPGLPFLIAIIGGLIVATVVVSSQTAGGPPPQSSPESQVSPAIATQE